MKAWKTHHEEKIRNHLNRQRTTTRIEAVKFSRSPLFVPGSQLQFGQVTVLTGPNGVGKSAICEWIAGLRKPHLLDRWTRRNAHHALNMEMAVVGREAASIRLAIAQQGLEQWSRDGVRQIGAPQIPDVVHLAQRYIRADIEDDRLGLADALGTDRATVEGIAGAVSEGSSQRFRDMAFGIAPDDDEEGGTGTDRDAAEPVQRLTVETYEQGERRLLSSFGGGVQTEVLLAFAAELTRHKSRDRPTLLIIDASDWGFDTETFKWLSDVIDDCRKYCQVLLVAPADGKHRANMEAREWVLYQLEPQVHGPHSSLARIDHI